jgi:hypothetical protein
MWMASVWTVLTCILVAGAASTLFVALGRRSACVTSGRPLRFDAEWKPDEPSAEAAEMQLQNSNIDASLKLVLKRLASIITSRRIMVDLAVSPHLTVQLSTPVLANILEELLLAAIHHSFAGRLLLTAWEHNGRIAVRVIDDVPSAGPVLSQRPMLSLAERIAFQGGTLDVDVQPAGTILTVWLASVEQASSCSPAEKASGPTACPLLRSARACLSTPPCVLQPVSSCGRAAHPAAGAGAPGLRVCRLADRRC